MNAMMASLDGWLVASRIFFVPCAVVLLGFAFTMEDSHFKAGVIIACAAVLFFFFMGALLARASNPSFFRSTLVIALVVKVIALLVVAAYVHFPDESGVYDQVGWQKAQALLGVGPPVQVPVDIRMYSYIVAGTYAVVGHLQLIPRLVNVFIGILLAWLVTILAARVFGERASRIVWLLMLFFPSMLLWSSVLLRDMLVIFLTILAVSCAVLFMRRPGAETFIGCMAAIAALVFFRSYVAAGVFFSFVLSIAVAAARQRSRLLIRLSVVCLVISLLILPALPDNIMTKLSLSGLQRNRVDLTTGNTAFGVDDDISTVTGLIAHLPLGLAYFLFAPFPWSAVSVLEFVVSGYMLLLYLCMILALVTLSGLSRKQAFMLLPAFFFFVVLLSFSAIIEGNVGTVMRHRAQIEPIILLLASVSLARLGAKN